MILDPTFKRGSTFRRYYSPLEVFIKALEEDLETYSGERYLRDYAKAHEIALRFCRRVSTLTEVWDRYLVGDFDHRLSRKTVGELRSIGARAWAMDN